MKRLSLLSGGEKSMTAIGFLFAVFLARPCPFYILDEVEAALDDPNITRFLDLLRRYADRAQFIVVTHQKRTMEAADTLYGVSMGDDGVSKVVSRRLPRDEAAEPGAPAPARQPAPPARRVDARRPLTPRTRLRLLDRMRARLFARLELRHLRRSSRSPATGLHEAGEELQLASAVSQQLSRREAELGIRSSTRSSRASS